MQLYRPWADSKPEPGYGLDPSSPLAAGLIGAWSLSEGGGLKVTDHSGQGNGLTITPGASGKWTAGKFGPAYNTAATGSLASSAMPWPGNAYSFAIWFTNVNPAGVLIRTVLNSTARVFSLSSSLSSHTLSLFNSDGTLNMNGTFSAVTSSGSWNHLAVVVTGTQILFYLNGTLGTTMAIGTTQTIASTAVPIQLSSSASPQLNGMIDNAMAWRYAVPASIVQLHYAEPFHHLHGTRLRNKRSLFPGVPIKRVRAMVPVGFPDTSN
jgi:hypothetical protein